MVRIQILSDLHLEAPPAYDIFFITPTAPYLALLGDIGNTKDSGLSQFLHRQLQLFEIVFFILGNHEPYHSSLAESKARLRAFQEEVEQEKKTGNQKLPQFIFLYQTRFDASESVTVLGCTLFSRITDEQKDTVSFGMNDFYHIENWDVDQHNAHHASDLQWLNTSVQKISNEEPNRKIIILSHYSPTTDENAVDPQHANSHASSGFMTDLAGEVCCRERNVGVWGFGHTHFNCDFLGTNGVRFFANQRGYYFRQAGGFDGEGFVEV